MYLCMLATVTGSSSYEPTCRHCTHVPSSYVKNSTFEKSWRRYKQLAPQAKLYLFDLGGYGQSPLRLVEPDVYLIAGWSDRVFDVLSAIDKGGDALSVINSIEV